MLRSVFVALALAPLVSSVALAADPGPTTSTALARERDAGIDHGFLTAHAETIGEGEWAINAYELALVSATYGFTDAFQASLSTLLPITDDIPLILALQPKLVVFRAPNTVVSVRLPITFSAASDSDDTLFTIGAGVAVDHVLDDRGRFAVHAGLSALGAAGRVGLTTDIGVHPGALAELDLGVSLGVTDWLKILVEGQMFAASTEDDFAIADLVLVNYGVRFHSGSISGDIGFIRPLGVDTDPLFLGVPYIAVSARW